MTRARKLTLKEFSHLVSESLDLANATSSPQSLLDNTTLLPHSPKKTHVRLSSFQRIFSRPTPTSRQQQDSLQGSFDDPPKSPRIVPAWPFSRSPKKNRPHRDEDSTTAEANDPDVRPYSVSSLAAASTSSFGSLLPDDERLFQVTLRESNEANHVSRLAVAHSAISASAHGSEPRFTSGSAAVPLDVFGSESAAPAIGNGTVEAASSSISSRDSSVRISSECTDASHPVTVSESTSIDEDPTPRATTFDTRATLPVDQSSVAERGRPQHLSIVVPPRKTNVRALRPAVGVEPHAPSGSLYSASPPTPPVALPPSPIFPTMPEPDRIASFRGPRATPRADARPSTTSSLSSSFSNPELGLPVGFSPRQRKRALSRSQTPPPLPRPPPTGPLPAVPSAVPPVPPLPPLLSKMNAGPNPIRSPPRPTMAGAPANPATALPPSPPGGLRLPSRLSWVNNVRAVLPSPPVSPTKSLKPLTGKSSLPISSQAEIDRPNELKRPTSIGVIEAAENVQVRRTKSILLLGSRSKSNTSLGTKRVQIHADVNVDTCTARKPRRKSSAAALGHPTSCVDFGPVIAMQSSELLVLRERRHSAPVLSSLETGASTDWTLSLPFCTDTPGNKIVSSSSSTAQSKVELALEEVQGEDWTLCMPLKVRVSMPTISSAGPGSACTETAEAGAAQPNNAQLPTPSPSPKWATPTLSARALSSSSSSSDPEESVPSSPEAARPASPASLNPDAGGLDLDGGRGKRGSGWHVYGWFDEVGIPEEGEQEEEDARDVVAPINTVVHKSSKQIKSHVSVFRKVHDVSGRQPSQDSTSTVSTSSTSFYSALSN